ncbi:dimethylsulfonioproprionate lyase family protein [Aquamicrobium sp. LC103]|uniref:dimethylsulfonioproprionate lyase family protein n=1 Tax=Aquamicrobium sp. LC103 TaxID=1120658 RepID=UPI00063E8D31|nr:dimethylsulfonioproprionate lyase family protein [Aquamicrobium sp. LC103]TKT78232.1 transcriptional regulator [Aquamicrobium sp. LC103]
MTETGRTEAVKAFLGAVRLGFEGSSPQAQTRACLARVFDRLSDPVVADNVPAARVPTSDLIDQALQPALQADETMAALAGCLRKLDPDLPWRMRGGKDVQPGETGPTTIANAMIVGPGGLEERRDVWVGVSLVPPGVRYPDHRHSPEEIYLFLTGGRFRHGESGWFEPGVGGSLYNEPNIQHSMEAPADAPLLAVWCLYDPRHA